MMAGLLAHGSAPVAAFPEVQGPQWHHGERLTAYSCGGSRGVGPKPAPRSLLIPEGNHRKNLYVLLNNTSIMAPIGRDMFDRSGLMPDYWDGILEIGTVF